MNYKEPDKKSVKHLTGKEKILEDKFGAEPLSIDEFDAESVVDEFIVDDEFIKNLTEK